MLLDQMNELRDARLIKLPKHAAADGDGVLVAAETTAGTLSNSGNVHDRGACRRQARTARPSPLVRNSWCVSRRSRRGLRRRQRPQDFFAR